MSGVSLRARTVRAGRFQAFISMGAVYVDRLPFRGPRSWRLVVSRRPVWLPFSEREGFRQGPRVWHLGPVDLAWYGVGVAARRDVMLPWLGPES